MDGEERIRWLYGVPTVPGLQRSTSDDGILSRSPPQSAELAALGRTVLARTGLTLPDELAAGVIDRFGRTTLLDFVAAAVAATQLPLGPKTVFAQLDTLGTLGDGTDDFDLFVTIATKVWNRAAPGQDDGIDLHRDLDAGLRDLPEPERRSRYTRIQEEILAEHRLTASAVERRGLKTVGRMTLWIWLRTRYEQQRQGRVEQARREISALSIQQIHDRILAYLQDSLTGVQLRDLGDDLVAICQEFDQNPPALTAAWTPLIIWADDRDAEIADDQAAGVHRRDPNAFWLLVQVLLTQQDQRMVNFASRAIERAEHTERIDPEDHELLEGLVEIIEEVAGIDPDDVRLESDADELDIDSLSMVELAIAVEEKYGIRIPDEDVLSIRTIREAMAYIKAARASQGKATGVG